MENLASIYRPLEFSDVCGQPSVIKILEKQIETGTFRNCYLFAGFSGCGKTTIARILANKINKGLGSPIEIDAASNSSVDNVRLIAEQSNERSLDSEYKVYIIDECHALSNNAWQAFLKTIEEPPKYTIFMFCTTEIQKVPKTILNRCQLFKLGKISDDLIKQRLSFICNKENYSYTTDSIEYITKLSDGSMRSAITFLDKAKDYSTNLTIESVSEALGNYSFDIFFDITNSRIDGNKKRIIEIIEDINSKGSDLKLFLDSYINFILDVTKYCIFGTIEITKIPSSQLDKLKYLVNIEDNSKFFNKYLEGLLSIKQMIKNDTNIKSIIEIGLMR